jgi:TonB family protein
MKAPSLQKTAVMSAGLHMMFFMLSFLILRQSHEMVMPSPYIVSLVGPASVTQRSGAAVEPGAAASPAETTQTKAEAKTETKTETKTHIDEKEELKSIEESIAALRDKRQKEKQLERILSVRRALVSIQGKGGTNTAKGQAKGAVSGSAMGEASYIDKITGQIHDEWHWPGYDEKNLEAIICVKIHKDGAISVINIEKKSGNRLFDKLALRTIEKASPVAPPPYEMEIGIRFYP